MVLTKEDLERVLANPLENKEDMVLSIEQLLEQDSSLLRAIIDHEQKLERLLAALALVLAQDVSENDSLLSTSQPSVAKKMRMMDAAASTSGTSSSKDRQLSHTPWNPVLSVNTLQLMNRICQQSERARLIVKQMRIYKHILRFLLPNTGVKDKDCEAELRRYSLRLVKLLVHTKEIALAILQHQDGSFIRALMSLAANPAIPIDQQVVVLRIFLTFLLHGKIFIRTLIEEHVCTAIAPTMWSDNGYPTWTGLAIKFINGMLIVQPTHVGSQLASIDNFAQTLAQFALNRPDLQPPEAGRDAEADESYESLGKLKLFRLCCSHSFEMRSAFGHCGLLESIASSDAPSDYWLSVATEFAVDAFGRQHMRESGLLVKMMARFRRLVEQIDTLQLGNTVDTDTDTEELRLLSRICFKLPCFIYDQAGLQCLIHETEFLLALKIWLDNFVLKYPTAKCEKPKRRRCESEDVIEEAGSSTRTISPTYQEVERQILASNEHLEKSYNVDIPLGRNYHWVGSSPNLSPRHSYHSPSMSPRTASWSPTASSVHSYMSDGSASCVLDDLVGPSTSAGLSPTGRDDRMAVSPATQWNELLSLDQVLTVLTWMSHSPIMPPIACNMGLIQSLIKYVVQVSEAHARMGRMLKRVFRDPSLFLAVMDARIPSIIGLQFCSKFCRRPIDPAEPSTLIWKISSHARKFGKTDWIREKLGRCAHCQRACRIGCLLSEDLQNVAENAFGIGALKQRINNTGDSSLYTLMALPYLLRSTVTRTAMFSDKPSSWRCVQRMCNRLQECDETSVAIELLTSIFAVPKTVNLHRWLAEYVPDGYIPERLTLLDPSPVATHCAHELLDWANDDQLVNIVSGTDESFVVMAHREHLVSTCGYYATLLNQGDTYRDTSGNRFTFDVDASIDMKHLNALIHFTHGCDRRCPIVNIETLQDLASLYRVSDLYFCQSFTDYLTNECLLSLLLSNLQLRSGDGCSQIEQMFANLDPLYSADSVCDVILMCASATNAACQFSKVLEDSQLRSSLAKRLAKCIPSFV